jgi:hypothetical protein
MFLPEGVPQDAAEAMQEDLGVRKDAPLAPDYEIMFPDREVRIGEEIITVREYTFAEGLRIGHFHRAFLSGLSSAFLEEQGSSGIDIGAIQAVLGEYWTDVLALMAISTGKPSDWISAISDGDGQNLLMTWWAVNHAFFARRLVAEAVSRKAKAIVG